MYLPPSLVLKALCVGVFKLCEIWYVYLFFCVVVKDYRRRGILEGHFVCVHVPPLLYL